MAEDLLNDIQKGLAEETSRMKLFPGIAFRGAKGERRAYMTGTDFDVWQIIDAHRAFDLAQSMVGGDGVGEERRVRLALDYYERFPEEIEAAIAESRRKLAQSREGFPFIMVSVP
jgi:hypothetical protein